MRIAAEERTGLSWRSIYKWLFDEKSKIPKSKFCLGFQLKDLKDSQFRRLKIFKIEKVPRKVEPISNSKRAARKAVKSKVI